jgi:hypothetical protein
MAIASLLALCSASMYLCALCALPPPPLRFWVYLEPKRFIRRAHHTNGITPPQDTVLLLLLLVLVLVLVLVFVRCYHDHHYYYYYYYY